MSSTDADYDTRLKILRRETLDRDLPAVLDAARSGGSPATLVMIDLDHFKSVNDQHGHPVGDEVLEQVAGLLSGVVGHRGKTYRYGGEELCVVLENFSAEEGASLAERARRDLEAAVISSRNLKVSASFGVAECPAHGSSVAEIIGAADGALYNAKRMGRNLVRISGEAAPSPTPRREPVRRQPEPGGLSDEQAEQLRRDYFVNGVARCPDDESVLRVATQHVLGRATPDLLMNCPVCGLRANLKGIERKR